MSLIRNILLWASKNYWISHKLPKYKFVQKSVSRFMPGETLDDALNKSSELEDIGYGTIITYLGENSSSKSQTLNTVKQYKKALEDIYSKSLKTVISVKLTQLGLDIDESKIFPRENRSSYEISQSMNYYHELGYESDHEKRTTELLKDALMIAHATDSINFSAFDIVAVIHAGVGQDFNLPFLDPTPEDIPSTFVDKDMINKYLGGPIQIGNNFI